jgi:DNA-binding response OmpR family regulator
VTRRLNVLIVEDDEALRDMYAELLEHAGHDVHMAADGREALEMLTNDLDLIVTDLNMPRLSGADFIAALRESSYYTVIPVLVITARPQALPDHLQGPWTSVIRKPFQLDQFTRFVEAVASRAAVH